MSTEFSVILDSALERLRQKDSISAILANYPDQADYLAPLLNTAEALNVITPVEIPPDEVLQMDRIEFLASIERTDIPSVSPSFMVRLKEQMMLFVRSFKFGSNDAHKERKKMNMLFVRTMLVLTLFFGITGGGYALTEGSLPGSPLYETKLVMEQAQLQMKTNPADVAGQHLIIARHRIRETLRLVQAGKLPDEDAMTQLEYHLNTAFQLAAQLGDDGEMLGVLTKTQNMLQEQTQQMNQVRAQVSGPTQVQLQWMLQLLTQAQNQAELGLQNPDAFRLQFRNEPSSEQPGFSVLSGDLDCPNCPCVDCDGVPDRIQDQNQDKDQDKYKDQDQIGVQSEPSILSDGEQDCPNCPCVDCDGVPDRIQDQTQDKVQGKDQDQIGVQSEPPVLSDGDQDCPNCPCVDCDGEPDQIQDQTQDKDQTEDQDQVCDQTQPNQFGSGGNKD